MPPLSCTDVYFSTKDPKPPMNLFVLIHDILPHHPQLFPTWGSILFPTLDPGGTRVQGSPGPLFFPILYRGPTKDSDHAMNLVPRNRRWCHLDTRASSGTQISPLLCVVGSSQNTQTGNRPDDPNVHRHLDCSYSWRSARASKFSSPSMQVTTLCVVMSNSWC